MREQRRSKAIAMTDEERDAFLGEERTCRVATVAADGAPHATPLWFVWDGTALWLTSIVKSQRWTDLQRDNRVAVVVDAGEDYMELRGVEIRGRAEPVGEVPRTGEPNEELDVSRAPERRQVHRGQVFHDGRHAWLRIVPDKIVSWDFRKLAALERVVMNGPGGMAEPRRPRASSTAKRGPAPRRDQGDHARRRVRRRRAHGVSPPGRHQRAAVALLLPDARRSLHRRARTSGRAERRSPRRGARLRAAVVDVVAPRVGSARCGVDGRTAGGRQPPSAPQSRGRPGRAPCAQSPGRAADDVVGRVRPRRTERRRSSSPLRCRASRSRWCRTRQPATTPAPTEASPR